MKYIKKYNEIVTHYPGRPYFKEICAGIKSYLESKGLKITKEEIEYQVEEFDVIKEIIGSKRNDVSVDIISVNSICDYYKVAFDKSALKKCIARSVYGALTNSEEYIMLGHSNSLNFINEEMTYRNKGGYSAKYIDSKLAPIIKKIVVYIESNLFIEDMECSIYSTLDGNNMNKFKFKFNEQIVDIGITKTKIKIKVGNNIFMENQDSSLKREIEKALSSYIFKYEKIITLLVDMLGITEDDLLDRFEEFEVIKGNKVDLISLNGLFDYLETECDLDLIKRCFEGYKIECIS